jgi:hypothetical protein
LDGGSGEGTEDQKKGRRIRRRDGGSGGGTEDRDVGSGGGTEEEDKFYSPRKVLQIYSDIWLPDFDSEK